MTKYGVIPSGKGMAAARQTGRFEVHSADCVCRRCKRARVARARRAKPRFGQQADGSQQ